MNWKPMSEAPRTGRIVANVNGGEMLIHWAQNLSGEEQPPFRGWFYWDGYNYSEVRESTIRGWKSLEDLCIQGGAK